MPPRAALVLLAVLALAAVTAPSATAVVGGREADPAAYPFLASTGGCTAALVAPDRLMTAAHCVYGDLPATRAWRLGSVPIGTGRPVTVSAIAVAPGYAGEGISPHDVALMQLAPPVTDVPPVRIATPEDAALAAPGAPVRVVGWGLTQPAGTPQHPSATAPSPIPHEADLAVVDFAACDDYFRHAPADPLPIPSDVLCAGAPPAAPCVGDSGAPLLAQDATGAWVTLGALSFGQRCGADGDPGGWSSALANRAFLTAAAPVWAPVPLGRPRIVGQARVGASVRCAAPRFRHTVERLRYAWGPEGSIGSGLPSGRSARHRVTAGEAGRRLTCVAAAANAGGYATSPPARAVTVRATHRR